MTTPTSSPSLPTRAAFRRPLSSPASVGSTINLELRVRPRRERASTRKYHAPPRSILRPDTCITRMCWSDPWVFDTQLICTLLGRLRRTNLTDDPTKIATAIHSALSAECVTVMVRYQPEISPQRWERIREFVEDAVAVTAPNCAYTTSRLLIVCSHYVDWAVNIASLPLQPQILFRRELISRYTSDVMNQAEGTRRNYRAILLRISEILLPDSPAAELTALNSRVSMEPYSDADLTRLEFWARGQNTPGRERNATVLLALCAGGGLWSNEACEARREDIQFDTHGVLVSVRGNNARQVPLLARWEPWLRVAVAGLDAGDRVFGSPTRKNNSKNLVTAFIQQSVQPPGMPRPQTNRMRATWLVTHLAARTDMRALMTASGIGKFENLARLLQFVPELDSVAYRQHLRGELNK